MERNNKSKYIGAERRQYKRLNIYHMSVPIRIKTNHDVIPGILLDISPVGVGLLIFKKISLGTIVELSISLNNLNTDIIKAQVIWIKSSEKTYRLGLKFIEISRKDFDNIFNFVEQHLKEDKQ